MDKRSTNGFYVNKCFQLLRDDEKGGWKPEHPISRTLGALKFDFGRIKNRITRSKTREEEDLEDNTDGAVPYQFPQHCDVVVIGGGAVGSSIAYWLKQRARDGLRVVVVEKDPSASF